MATEHLELAAGATVGRYVVLRRLGAGGTGAVYAAFDPSLDRRVALKVLFPLPESLAADGAGGRAWLLHESQALARLAHPNVVALHDVGTVDGQVFMAMELVDGQTLAEWLAREPRRPREILSAFVSAGRGLAAAHAKSLVHRDFKPDKVLVGHDGRVRVTDFGLARPLQERANERALGREEPRTGSASPLDAALTRVGVGVGTPAFLSPEQCAGEPADVRSDQFSFCVALYRALWRRHPFLDVDHEAQATAADFAGALCRPARVPPRSGVSWAVRAAILKGLSISPSERHASMETLLAELSRRPLLTLPRAAAAMALLALLTTSGVLWTKSRAALSCDGLAGELEGVWDAALRRRLHAAFLGTGLGYAEGTFARTEAALSSYASVWLQQRAATCEAARAGRNPELRDRERLCLERRRGQLRALTNLLTREPDAELLEKAVLAARSLESVEVCGDPRALMEGTAPPQDVALRERLAQLEAQVAAVEALYTTGKYALGLEKGNALLAEVRPLAWDPLLARLELATARLLERTGDDAEAARRLRAAIVRAARAGENSMLVDAWGRLVLVVGYRMAHYAEALALELPVTAAAARTTDVRAKAAATLSFGSVYYALGRPEEARRFALEAMQALEQAFGPDDVGLDRAMNDLASALGKAARHEEALGWHLRALALRERTLGPEHPLVALSANNVGAVLNDLGRIDEAKGYLERAIRTLVATTGEESPSTTGARSNLGLLLYDLGRAAEGVALHRSLLAIDEQRLGPNHPTVALTLSYLGRGLRELGRLDESKAQLDRALAITEAAVGADNLYTSEFLLEAGLTEVQRGSLGRARILLGRALTVRRTLLDPNSFEVAQCVVGLAELERKQGHTARAIEFLDQAVPNLTGLERSAAQVVEAGLLWQVGRERPRAAALARDALRTSAEAGHEGRVAEVTRWLSERGL